MPSQNYRVFISYSRKDEDKKDRLLIYLDSLAYDGTITKPWHDRIMEAGDIWRQELEKAMKETEVALLLVSADFIASPFCQSVEVPQILKRHRNEGVIVIPIIVSPCNWRNIAWLNELNALPKDGNPVTAQLPRDKAWTQVIDGIRHRLETKPPGKKPPTRTIVEDGEKEPERFSLPELLQRLPGESGKLFGREEALGWLDAAYDDSQTGVLALVGFGGVGKSALVRHWLEKRFSETKDGAPRFLGVSFYSQGTREQAGSSDQFLIQALEKFDEQDPGQKSAWDRGQRLAELVAAEPTLLVLDGLEPLQYGPGPHKLEGQLKDPGVHRLLARLSAQPGESLCIVTTRLRLEDSDLQNALCVQQSVETLSREAASKLLRARGVRGSDEEINAAAKYLDHHPLALVLAAEYLHTFEGGEVNRLREINLSTEKVKEGRHAKSVMKAYEKALQRDGDPLDLELLGVLGLFDRPARWEWVKALSKPPAINGVTDHLVRASNRELWEAISRLRQWGMLSDLSSLEAPELDAHPLVREYFGEKLHSQNEIGWREAHSRLFDYLTSAATEFPDTLNEMESLYEAITHGCEAGRYQETMAKVYDSRICRGKEFFSTKKLGAFATDLAALTRFFEIPLQRPVSTLSDNYKAFVMSMAGFCVRALGQLTKAVELTRAGMDGRIQLKEWKNASIDASNLSGLYLTLGDLRQALVYAEKSVELADKDGDIFQRIVNRTTLGDALHQMGRLSEAEDYFREAEQMQKGWQTQYPILYSFQGFRHCDLLLEQGKYAEALSRAIQASKMAKLYKWLLSIGLDHLSLGRAYLMQAQRGNSMSYAQATDYLNQAVDGLRLPGALHHLPRGLLARAELHKLKREFNRARADLDEALSIAARHGMKLHQADCHLGYARLFIAQGKKEKAQDSLETGREMVEQIGYHRRDRVIKEIEQQIAEMSDRSGEE